MKKLLVISALFVIGCNGELPSTHEMRYSPDGTDSIAYVTYRHNGVVAFFPMSYNLFEELYKQGGYKAAFEYYNREDMIEYLKKKYSRYKPRN